MKLRVSIAVAIAAFLVVLTAGCGHATRASIPYEPKTRVPADLPPSPSTWPPYPAFSQHSCWTRPYGFPVGAGAPSYAPATTTQPATPAEIVQRLLARFGDRRFIRQIEIGPMTAKELHQNFSRRFHPPSDLLWANIVVPKSVTVDAKPENGRAEMLSEWEVNLVVGALRDDFCAAGGSPLVGWTASGIGGGLSDRSEALEQRFPNPSPQAFRARVDLIGRRFGFRVVSLKLLRPEQIAPLLVVETKRPRKQFIRDVAAINALLDPTSHTRSRTAATFEGFFFEARDARGAFVRTSGVSRGSNEGGQWSWNRCDYPYPVIGMIGTKPCPSN